MDLFNKAAADTVWFQISNTGHMDIAGGGFYSADPKLGWEVNRTVNAYTLWFLNKYLMGSTDRMPSPKDFPRLFNLKQK
jgi:hypothetical protein